MKKFLALILAAAMLLLPACAGPKTDPEAVAESSYSEAAPEAIPAMAEAPEAAEAAEAGAVVWPDPGIEGCLTENPSPKDDLAAYLNYDWYKTTDIPEGYSAWSSFSQLDLDVRGRMIETLRAPDASADQQKAAALFAAALDWDTRNSAGLGSVKATLEAILAAKDLAAINTLLTEDPHVFLLTPLVVAGVDADAKNSAVNVATVHAPYLSLSDSAEYAALTEQGAQMKEANAVFYKALLTHNGVAEAEAEQMIQDLLAWETQLAKGVYTVETSYCDDYIQMTYNEYSREALAALTPDFPLLAVLDSAGLGHCTRFIVAEPDAIKTLNDIYTEENLPGVKAYLATGLLSAAAGYCDSFSDDAAITWSNTIYGSTGRKPEDVRAFTLCNGLIDELLGRIYAAKYSNEAAKTDVTQIVYEVFDAYKTRLAAADWLTAETRATAVEKLDAMTLRIGYPEVYRFDWDKIPVSADKPLIENTVAILAERTRQLNQTAGQPVDKTLWIATAHTVNAFYNPSDNSINFPAAILQAPFYSAEYSRSENLGGIGNVIAHEITHAFDTGGSQYDKDGNLVNWWTDGDRAAFKARTDKVAARFAAIEVIDGEHVRGDLTIGETVADLGAVACTLDIMKTLEQPDYEGYIGTWTRVWAQRITPETRVYYLKYDPHAPSYLRANVTLQQFDALYETYDIQPGDFMYVAPAERLSVW